MVRGATTLVRTTSLALPVFLSLLAGAGERLSERLAAREGDTCLVCNRKVGKGDSAYLANGQKVALHAAAGCEAKFLREPRLYTASLRPSSIQAAGLAAVGLPSRWMWFGVYVLAGLICGGLSAHLAVRTGFSPAGWFLLGFLLLAGPCLYLRRRSPRPGTRCPPPGMAKPLTTLQPVACPACGAANHPSASRCLACGGRMEPQAPSEVEALKRP